MLIAAGTFVVVLTVIVGMYWLVLVRPEDQEQADLRRRLKGDRKKAANRVELVNKVKQLSNVPFLNRFLAGAMATTGPLQRTITESGIDVSVGLLLLASAFLGMLIFVLVSTLAHQTIM